ncbi:hypothetical protein A7K91_09685 [Paenibacillus oryzae]|uniref:Uncharacterized protein n=1 Tax=Paenibacillus oryzae TaxID=1844972 RepID=A0A1A5YBK4_9BACL|nr:hypothetical protein [Paenibacillus oryzae]OBR62977.1 hypothetical protein A7K91_09685 [Paenibacillus oryzae]
MLMKNKVLSSFIMILVLALISIYVYYDQTTLKEAPLGHFNHAVYDSAKDLYDDVELVVLANVTSESKAVIIEGEYLDGYSLTEVNVEHVIKNDGESLSNQDSITIIEPAFTMENKFPSVGKTQYYSEDYRKAAPGASYLLFLNWDENKEAYWVHALHQGKFNVDQSDLKEMAVQEHNEQFKALKADVIQTYFNTIELE